LQAQKIFFDPSFFGVRGDYQRGQRVLFSSSFLEEAVFPFDRETPQRVGKTRDVPRYRCCSNGG
jgi:hypothetical protein